MKLFFLCLALLLAQFLSAQENRTVYYGVKGGIHFNRTTAKSLDTDSGVATGSADGYYGAFSEIQLHTASFLNAELLFSQTVHFNLLQFPVHYRHQFYKNWSVFAGPQLDFVVNDSLVEVDQDIVLKKYGFTFDFGFQYDLGPHFYLEGRYGIGITELSEDLGQNTTNLRLYSLRFGLGYVFSKTRKNK